MSFRLDGCAKDENRIPPSASDAKRRMVSEEAAGGENTDQSWVLAKVDSIITERYNKMLPIIVTTNLSKEELMGTYSGRIVDRLRNTSKYLAFHGASQRVARA